jgi:hypothetical protein
VKRDDEHESNTQKRPDGCNRWVVAHRRRGGRDGIWRCVQRRRYEHLRHVRRWVRSGGPRRRSAEWHVQKPNENATHETKESAQREAEETAGKFPTTSP